MSQNKAFTLLESVIVLFIISLLACFALSWPKKSDKQIQTDFLKQYESFFNQAQLLAQREDHDIDFVFQDHTISFSGQNQRKKELLMPKKFHSQGQHLLLKANGYVAPTRIVFSDNAGKVRFSLIYSLGFGNYRVSNHD